MSKIKCKYFNTSPNNFNFFSNHFKFDLSLHTTLLQEDSNGKYLWFMEKSFFLLYNIHVNHYSFSSKIKRSILRAIYMHSLSYVILLIIGVPFESTLLAIKYYFHTSSILMYYLTF